MNKNSPLVNLTNFMNQIRHELDPSIQIATGQGSPFDLIRYFQAAKAFNRRLQFHPFVVVYCESAEDVQKTYLTATKNFLPVRVRAGGHDHEGESNGTNTILMDVSKMDSIHIDEDGIAHIGPGNRFIRLTTELANNKVMVPHGTCATVGISGFTLGGGWGPWTRSKGMCCEHLVGASIMLGDGEIIDVDVDPETKEVPHLLWALRGGGGMSYGIVTEFRIQTFELPKKLIKFELEWNLYEAEDPDKIKPAQGDYSTYPTIDVLQAWEGAIRSTKTPKLIGTNLKVNGKPAVEEPDFDANTVVHNCLMYGYWQGDRQSLRDFVDEYFEGVMPAREQIDGEGGRGKDYGQNLMSSWDRISYENIQLKMDGREPKPIPPDLDDPAPHKITSRLVEPQGLGEDGYEQFLRSMTSEHILPGNRGLGLFTYVTLGAIVGDFYNNRPIKLFSAFPYKKMLYTIQYQCWWNEDKAEKQQGQENPVYDRSNRGLDWIEAGRKATIANTSGAFISFKDSSVPTSTYFAQNYEKLIQVKENYSRDPLNHFRTRKTII